LSRVVIHIVDPGEDTRISFRAVCGAAPGAGNYCLSGTTQMARHASLNELCPVCKRDYEAREVVEALSKNPPF
jgi:hypothetical protein